MDRPLGVTLLSVLLWVGAAGMLILGGIGLIGAGVLRAAFQETVGQVGAAVIIGIVLAAILLAAIFVILGIGLWRLKNWARVGLIVGSTISAVVKVIGTLLGDATQLIGLVVDAAIIWYLTRPHVKEAFTRAA